MADYDKRHSLEVWRRIGELAPGDVQLQAAALLHDVGKGLPSVAHRVALVLAQRLWPRDLGRWSKMPPISFQGELWSLANQAEIGARFLEKANSHPRTIQIVRSQGDPKSPEGSLLERVDSQC